MIRSLCHNKETLNPRESAMSYQTRLVLLVAGLLCMSAFARSQEVYPQTGSSSPASGQSAPSQSVGTPGSSATPSNSQLQPDTHPLAGAYLYTLGSALEGRSYIAPAFSLSEAAETNPTYTPNSKQTFSATTIPMAEFSLVHQGRTNELQAGYLGGAFIYDNGGAPNSTFHEFNLTDVKRFRRLQVSLSDIFRYLPNGAFGSGFGGFGGGISGGFSGGSGFGGGGLVNPAYTQDQSILTSQLGSINNTILGEAVYSATARTKVSVGGSYGILQSGNSSNSSAGFLGGNNAMGFVGIQHDLTARDTLGVIYDYGTFHYVGLAESFQTQSLNLAYGRKITGRLALQLYGGPELLNFHSSQSPSFTHVAASGTGALTYLFGRNTLGLFVSRLATGGSGVFAGSDTTIVSGNWTRQLTRRWSGTVYGGYARNTQLSAVGTTSAGHFNSFFANARLNRDISPYLSLYLGYDYERQITNSGPCTTVFCAGNLATQIFGAGITFRPRPIGL